jgi:hypothetical protein
MEKMEFEFEYRKEDENFRARAILRRMGPSGDFVKSRFGLWTFVAMTGVMLYIMSNPGSVLPALLTLAAVLAWIVCRNIWAAQRLADDGTSPLFGRKTCKADVTGIAVESQVIRFWLGWPSVRDIEDGEKYISIYYDMIRALVIPKSSFRDAQQQADFIAVLRQYIPPAKIAREPSPVKDAATGFFNLKVTAILTAALLAWLYMSSISINTPVAGITATVDKTEVTADTITVLGKLQNPSSDDWQMMMLQLQFTDAGGKFIDQCYTYTYSTVVKAGGSEMFKAACSVPKAGSPPGQGNAILPSTLKNFRKVEVKPGTGYKTGWLGMFR